MKHVLSVAVVALACAAGGADAQVPTSLWVIVVQVDPHKPDGSAWDALGGAPDIAACFTSAAGQGCAAIAGQQASCPDTFSCRFNQTLPTTGFTATFWDLDVGQHDQIGSCYIDRPGNYRCGSASVSVM